MAVVNIYQLRESNFRPSPLADFGGSAPYFAGDTEGYTEGFCVGQAWHGRVAAGGQVALGSSRC